MQKSRKKVRNLVFVLESTSPNGGMIQSVLALTEILSRDPSFKIFVVCSPDSKILSRFSENVTVLVTKHEWHVSLTGIFRLLSVGRNIARLLKSLNRKDTVLISNNVGGSLIISFTRIFRHFDEVYVNRGGNFNRGAGARIMAMKLKYKLIRHVIATSQKQADVVAGTGFDRSRTNVIHNGLAMPPVSYGFRPLMTDGKLVIGTIGFISSIKNQVEGVRLISLLRSRDIDAHLNIYGSATSLSDKEYNNILLKEIDKLGMDKYIHFKGFVAGDEKFTESDIIVSFSHTEGFGRTLVEGILRYKPIIAWRGAGGPVDITADGRYGYLVEHNTANDYAAVIIEMLKSPEALRENVISSYDYACEHFTISVMGDKYVRFFKQY